MLKAHSLCNVAKTLIKSLRNMSSMANPKDYLVWVDLEMTGLDVDRDHIIEMACLITDADLGVVATGPNMVVHQPRSVMDGMNDWCREQHGKSGLTEAVVRSSNSLKEVEDRMVTFLKQNVPPRCCPLAGNSVHADKRFLDKYMPRFMAHLHYRIVDVSSIKELCRRWYPGLALPAKQAGHRALDDIEESVEELKFYRKSIFKELP